MNSEFYTLPIVYAAKYKDDKERLASQSGGAFAAISEYVLESGGSVYGCVFNNQFEAIHIRAADKDNRNKMRYSKYVQSDLLGTYKEVASDLKSGISVLFSGTSCQIAGLKKYVDITGVKSETGKLYCVDIVCHGVPSPRVWKDYLNWESKQNRSNIDHVICRDKASFGWKSHVVTIRFSNGKSIHSRVFPQIFYGHNALRPSCYKCPYKKTIHPGDITIADYWGIDQALPGYKDNKGVSLILVNNDTGKLLLDKCSDLLDLHQTKLEDSMQRPLISPYDSPKTRAKFWEDYNELDFTRIAKRYGGYGVVNKIKRRIKIGGKKFIKLIKRQHSS